RSWGTCAVVGGLVGAGVGAASGIVIADSVAGRHQSDKDARAYAGVGGAAIGAGIGALAGHYICDPLIPPPPPLPPPPPPPSVRQKLVLRGVHFDFNKSKILPGDAAVLDEAASTLKANPNVTI